MPLAIRRSLSLSPEPMSEETVTTPGKLILAVPKGRILREAMPLIRAVGIEPEPAFADDDARQLRFATNLPALDVIRVRSFDVATFVAFGAAQFGICGADVLMEFDYAEIYAPLDLGIGGCRVSVCQPRALSAGEDPRTWSHIRIATKYPNITTRHFAGRGVHAECVHLNGAMELAPARGARRLSRWAEPRAADRPQRALLLKPGRARFHEADDVSRLRRGRPCPPRRHRGDPRQRRRPRRPRPLDRRPPQSLSWHCRRPEPRHRIPAPSSRL
jgi:ATP phosphoribosyltransferase